MTTHIFHIFRSNDNAKKVTFSKHAFLSHSEMEKGAQTKYSYQRERFVLRKNEN